VYEFPEEPSFSTKVCFNGECPSNNGLPSQVPASFNYLHLSASHLDYTASSSAEQTAFGKYLKYLT